MLITFFINILLYKTGSQSYNHFLFRITFICFIFCVSILILISLLKYYSIISHIRIIFAGLCMLTIAYLIICDERILSGITGQVYESSNPNTILIISMYTLMIRYILLDSFLYITIICIYSLLLTLITVMVLSSVSFLSGLADFLILLAFLVIELMETHQVDLRTRQLF